MRIRSSRIIGAFLVMREFRREECSTERHQQRAYFRVRRCMLFALAALRTRVLSVPSPAAARGAERREAHLTSALRRCAPGERALAFRRSTAALANSSRVAQLRAGFPRAGHCARLVQQAPCRAVVLPPDGVPEPPECEVTSPARRRRTPLRLSERLRKTPLDEQGGSIYGYFPSTSRIIFRTSFRCHAASARDRRLANH